MHVKQAIINQSPQPPFHQAQICHYPYLSTLNCVEFEVPYEKYILHSIARIHKNALSVYEHYFISVWKKSAFSENHHLHRNNFPPQIRQQHLSVFFRLFVDIVMLKSRLRPWKGSLSFEVHLANEICGQSKGQLFDVIKKYIRQNDNHNEIKIQDNQQNKLIQSQKYIKNVKIIDKLIHQKLTQFYQTYSTANYNHLEQTQFLPPGPKDQILPFIQYNFKCILNNKLLFYTTNMKDKLMKQIKFRHDYLKMKLPINKQTQKKIIHYIFIRRQSQQTIPIITPLKTYLSFHQRNHKFIDKHVLNHIITKVIQDCSRYNNNTGYCIPHLSINDIFFDQKGLKTHLNYRTLVMDIIGLDCQTFSIENRLAYRAATVNFPDNHQCYLQLQQNYRYKLQQRRFLLSQSSQKYIENECPYCQQKDNNNLNDTNLITLMQNVHVWRLITAIYFIIYTSDFSKDIYSQNYTLFADNSSKTFHFHIYQQILEQSYQMICNGQINLKCLLNTEEKIQVEDRNKMFNFKKIREQDKGNSQDWNFDFTLKDLRDVFKIDNGTDSLLRDLKFTKHGQYLTFRLLILKQMQGEFFSGKVGKGYFRKLQRTQVYLISLCTLIYEHIYGMIYTVCQQRLKDPIRPQLNLYYSKSHNNIILKDEFQKRQQDIMKLFDKLYEYRKDKKQQKSLRQYKEIIKLLDIIKAKLLKMIQIDRGLNQQQQSMSLLKHFYEGQLVKIEELGQYCVGELKELLLGFLKMLIEVKNMKDIHKIDEISKQQDLGVKLAEVHHRKVIILMKMQLKVTHNNWKSIQQLYHNFLLSNKKHENSGQGIQQLILVLKSYEFINSIVDRQVDFNYNMFKLQKNQKLHDT